MKGKKIYILAPNDRFNYGDLIFPYILRYYLSEITNNFVFCSTTKSDLSNMGGIKTCSFKELYNMDKKYDNYLIIAGGESLFVPWWPILSYSNKKANFVQFQLNRLYFHVGVKLKMSNALRDRLIDSVLKPIFGFKTRYPFTINKYDIRYLNGLYYNSVGNVNLLYDKEKKSNINRDIMNSADYISVRDEQTSIFLNQLGVNHVVAPDTAILMSEIFNESFLQRRIRKDIYEFFISHKYIFFQINYINWSNNKEKILEQLSSIINDNEHMICLCPIGTAMGHEDDKALFEIYISLGKKNRAMLIDIPSLWEIMWLIAHSQLYIGTSLHGVITSLSFNVPYLSYSVSKVEAYLEQWTNDVDKHFCKIEEISVFSDALLNSSSNTQKDSNRQKELALQSIKNIHDKIKQS